MSLKTQLAEPAVFRPKAGKSLPEEGFFQKPQQGDELKQKMLAEFKRLAFGNVDPHMAAFADAAAKLNPPGMDEVKIGQVCTAFYELCRMKKDESENFVTKQFRDTFLSSLYQTESAIRIFISHPQAIVELAGNIGRSWISTSAIFPAISGLGDFFGKHVAELLEISKCAGAGTASAFFALRNKMLQDAFEKNPEKFKSALVSIGKTFGESSLGIYAVFYKDDLACRLAEKPDETLAVLEGIAGSFKKEGSWQNSSLFSAIADAMAFNMASNLHGDRNRILLGRCIDGEISMRELLVNLKSDNNVAIELGRQLDDFHDNATGRGKYLRSLATDEVFSLLLSNPELFYTSTNHLLFDRLQEDLGGKAVSELLEELNLGGTELERNLLFRAINYGRFMGGSRPIFSMKEGGKLIQNLLFPLRNEEFDEKYFFILANSIQSLVDAGYKDLLQGALDAEISSRNGVRAKGISAEHGLRALTYLSSHLDNLSEGTAFDPSKYRDKDGKLLIVQVFDKEDTGKDHWGLSNKWFSKYGKAKKGELGEMIYENKDARVILYMGENEMENQQFLKEKLRESPNMLLTFRGHSFSLTDNLPFDIFGESAGNILFIPGSCGSSGSIPTYISTNPKISFEFAANTSTGRGQVTNALIDIFIREASRPGRMRTYEQIVREDHINTSLIKRNGGDPSTISVVSPGERMLAYVYGDEI